MAPGFALLLAIFSLTALSPLVVAVAVICFFFPTGVAYGKRILSWGLLGAFVGTSWVYLLVYAGTLSWSLGSEQLAVCASGFTLFSVAGTLAWWFQQRRGAQPNGAPNPLQGLPSLSSGIGFHL